jgi:hypothetical protein
MARKATWVGCILAGGEGVSFAARNKWEVRVAFDVADNASVPEDDGGGLLA